MKKGKKIGIVLKSAIAAFIVIMLGIIAILYSIQTQFSNKGGFKYENKRAASYTLGDFGYEIVNDTIEITEYTGNAESVEIPGTIDGKTVTKLGNNLFFNNNVLTSVTIPEGVTVIGEGVFNFCTSLESIIIPNTVTSIGKNAFASCYQLQSLNISKGVMSIGEGAFWGCQSLATVVFEADSQLNSIGKGAFKECKLLESIEIPDGATTIEDEAFADCTKLKKVTCTNSIDEIGANVFQNCSSSLTLICIVDKDTSLNDIYTLDYVELDCEQEIKYECYAILEDDTVQIKACVLREAIVTLPETFQNKQITSIGEGALCGSFSKVESLTLSSGITEIAYNAFNDCSTLYEINVVTTNAAFSSQDGVLFDKAKTILIRYPQGKNDEQYSIPDTVTSIEQNAFYKNEFLKNIEIPTRIISLGEKAFYDCNNLEKVVIQSNVKQFGDRVFDLCSKLCLIIEDNENNVAIKTYAQEENIDYMLYTILEDETIEVSRYYGDNVEFNIPSSIYGKTVTSIGDNTFSELGAITKIEIPNSVTKIGARAFNECEALADIVIPENVTYIGNSAFDHCSAITHIKIPKGITKISDGLFSYCIKLESVEIPNGITSIGDFAFNNCTSLSDIVWFEGENVTEIPESTIIGSNAFAFCKKLTQIIIPDVITEIHSYAFLGCELLETIEIPANVSSIAITAFDRTASLAEINAVEGNENYSSENGVLFNKTKTEIVKYPEGRVDTEYVVPYSVTDIGERAFLNCKPLTNVLLPDSIKTIKDSAFEGCESLNDLEMPDQLESIGAKAFAECTSIETIVIPMTTTNIGTYAFSKCLNLEKIIIPDNVIEIGINAFAESEKVSIVCREASYALGYANDNNVTSIIDMEVNNPATLIMKFDSSEGEDCPKGAITKNNIYTLLNSNASDNVSGINTVYYSINGELVTKQEREQRLLNSQGQYEMVVTTIDNLGNTATETYTVTIDRQAPTISEVVTTPNTCTESLVILTIVGGADTLSGLAPEAYSFDGGESWQTKNEKKFYENTSGIVIKVRDKAGNVYTHSEVEINNIGHNYVDGECNKCGDKLDIVITSQKYNINHPYILNVRHNTKVGDFKYFIETNATEVNFYSKDGKNLKDTDFVTTGTQLELKLGEKTETYTIIVLGDVNGDSKITILDMTLLNMHRLKKERLDGINFLAGDITGEGEITFIDLVKMHLIRLSKM